jgi:phosphoglycerate dehydrogenase-like enzyme/glyoxylase-like metal-dependent hydrolase (beta-lactamase superfamily II)
MNRIAWICLLGLALPAAAADDIPKMKFNEVKEIAPGVFFRYSSIGPEGSGVPFGGSNHVWIVFEDYVVVVDANFPKGAEEVIAAIKKTTDKPIRYVLDTHHHGDHAYGNDVFGREGATIVAQANCARLLRVDGPKEFAEAGKPPAGREDVRNSKLKVPSLVFDDRLVLDDGKQRVEFLFLGHAHTAGDAFAYLPKQKILCTGDACVNGAYNFMGHSDSASWIRVLERGQQLDVRLICPGHGPMAGKDLLETQKRYFVELRQQVRQGLRDNKTEEDIIKSIDMPWYKEWTGINPTGDNIKFVYAELTGRTKTWDLVEDFGAYEGPSPTKDSPGWKPPRRIVVPSGLRRAQLAELKRVAPDVEFIPARSAEDAVKVAEDADAVLGFCTPEVARAGKNLRWIQTGHAGVTPDLAAELAGKVVLTDTRRVYGPPVADHAFALLLSLTRGLRELPQDADRQMKEARLQELQGKTLLVVGLGGVGTQVARRAHAFGMRVRAVDPRDRGRPTFVFSLDKPAKLMDLLPEADVVVLACPLTAETSGLMGPPQLRAMQRSAYLINVGHGGLVQTGALVDALDNKRLAGAGLDATDPDPLPADHLLRKRPNVLISPHVATQSPGGMDRQWRLWRENVRRFAAGERLLCVVDREKGY